MRTVVVIVWETVHEHALLLLLFYTVKEPRDNASFLSPHPKLSTNHFATTDNNNVRQLERQYYSYSTPVFT